MFQSKQCFAINFSDTSLEALELKRVKGRLVIASYGRLVLEVGIIEDGKIIQADKLRDAVKSLLQQAQPAPITANEVVITVPESRVFAQRYSLPQTLPSKQVPSALFSQAKESMPLDVSLAAADFEEVGRAEAVSHYLFAATYASLIEEYSDFFRSLRLKVVLVTMESLAVGAAVLDETKDETVLVLDIGARTTIASIFKQGELFESININIAGNNITASLAEKLKISPADAEQRKMTAGLSSMPDGGAEMLIIQGQLQPLKDEVLVFMKYYERIMEDSIDRVFLTGGTAAMTGVDEYFSANLGLPASAAVPLPIFEVTADRGMLSTFLVVLGLARIGMGDRRKRIDFLERKEKDWIPQKISMKSSAVSGTMTSKKKKSQLPLLFISLGIIGIIFIGILWWRYPGLLSRFLPASLSTSARIDPVPSDGETTVVVKSFTGSDAPTNFSYSFAISLSDSATQPGDLRGAIRKIQIAKAISYDDAIVGLVSRRFVAVNSRQPTDDEATSALKRFLAEQLWEDNRDYYVAEELKSGRRLLESYIDNDIVDATASRSDDSSTESMTMSVTYRVLILDNEKEFLELEKKYVRAFDAYNQKWHLNSRSFKYEEQPTDRVNVFAFYIYQRS